MADVGEFERRHGKSKAAAKQMDALTKLNDVKIVSLNFAYHNHELINLLRERGTAITALKFEKITELDQKLTDLIQNEEKY